MADTRKDKRAPVSLKVRFKSATVDEFIEHYSKDVSRGGIYIKSSQPLPVGTLLKFQFQLKDESALIRGVGRVVWTRAEVDAAADQPAGMGIKFIKMDNESRAMVERIIEAHASEGGSYESGRYNATSAEPFASDPPLTEDSESSMFPSLPPAELPPPEDRTAVRQATQLLAAVLAEGGTDRATAREAEQRAEEARRRTEEIEAQRRREQEERRAKEREQSALPSMIVDAALSPRAPRASLGETADLTPLPRPSQELMGVKHGAEVEDDEPDTEPPTAPTTTTPTVTTSIPDTVSETRKRRILPIMAIAAVLAIALIVALRGGPRELVTQPTSEPLAQPARPAAQEQPAIAPAPAREEPAAEPPIETTPPVAETPPPSPAATLVPVDVVTAPPGAEIYVGTELRGTSPLTLELAAGTPVVLRARAPGHAETSQQLTPESKRSSIKLRLLPLPYVVQVETSPRGAAINVAGRKGTSPVEVQLPEPPTGEMAVSARLPGYEVTRARLLPSHFSERDGAMRAEVNINLTPGAAGAEGTAPARRSPPRQREAPAAQPEAAPPEAPPAAPPPAAEAPAAPRAPKEDIPDNPFGD